MAEDKKDKLVLALGFFDGVHAGHGALLRETAKLAVENGAVPAAVIFDKRPLDIVTGSGTELINTVEDRKYIISKYYGIKKAVPITFTRQFMETPWDEFITSIVKKYQVVGFVAGYDFRFGYKGAGDAEKLESLCRKLGIACRIIGKVQIDGVTVSSTHIRELIREGDIRNADRFLGHPHILTAKVIDGYRLGRTIGIPTANMVIPKGIITPKHGVYAAVFCTPDGGRHLSVTNVGVRPTVSGSDHVTVESHLIDFSGDLYGTNDRVEYMDFIRPEQKFGNVNELKNQINLDILKVKQANAI